MTLAFFEVATRIELVNPIIVPPPSEIAVRFVELLGREFFWTSVGVTLRETLFGFVLGTAAGFLVGALTANIDLFRRAIYPYVIAFQNLPKVALAPIFLTWFGFGLASKVVMAAAICFFSVVITTITGLGSVPSDARLMVTSLGAKRSQVFIRLTLPNASPFIFAGIKEAMTLALVGAIVAEFVGASEGLGVLVETLNFRFDIAGSFAVLIVLSAMGLALYGVVAAIDRRVNFWTGETQG